MIKHNIQIARASIRSARLRSLLTMFGIIIGVASVIVVVGLGDGLRNQVTGQITKLGSNLIIVQPGNRTQTTVLGLNSLEHIGGTNAGVITEQDLATIAKTKNVSLIAPVATITGVPRADNRTMEQAIVVGTTDALPTILGKKVPYGTFFGSDDQLKNYAVIGPGVAAQLFSENVPIGLSFTIRDIEFIVQGVFEQTPLTPLSPSVNFNDAIVIPYEKAKQIGAGSLQINQILVTSTTASQTKAVADSITKSISANHGGQHDFSVLSQKEALAISDGIFSQLTLFVTSIAAISLLVSSIGIMNIMFATVSERTREIGIRKAIGAKQSDILLQFLVEAATLTGFGGVVGLLIGWGLTLLISLVFPSYVPWWAPPLGFFASVGIGVIFGLFPAWKAARLDPIESLRYE